MIIFTSLDIPTELLEEKRRSQVIKYNLTSYIAGIPTLDMLLPRYQMMDQSIIGYNNEEDDINFDYNYCNFVTINDSAFIQLMSIMIPVYDNPDVLVEIMISESLNRDEAAELLAKLIQQRYGYNSYMVKSLEDFLYVDESTFSIPGLFTMDKDIERYISLTGGLSSIQDD